MPRIEVGHQDESHPDLTRHQTEELLKGLKPPASAPIPMMGKLPSPLFRSCELPEPAEFLPCLLAATILPFPADPMDVHGRKKHTESAAGRKPKTTRQVGWQRRGSEGIALRAGLMPRA